MIYKNKLFNKRKEESLTFQTQVSMNKDIKTELAKTILDYTDEGGIEIFDVDGLAEYILDSLKEYINSDHSETHLTPATELLMNKKNFQQKNIVTKLKIEIEAEKKHIQNHPFSASRVIRVKLDEPPIKEAIEPIIEELKELKYDVQYSENLDTIYLTK